MSAESPAAQNRVATDDDATYSFHTEPPRQGGARYIRCECCGREAIPAKRQRVRHRADCPEADR